MAARTAAGLLLAPLFLLTSGCARARAERLPAAPERPAPQRSSAPSGRLVLSGELTAAHSTALSVPETSAWQIAVRWMETDGALVKKGDKVVEFDNSLLTAGLEEKRIAKTEAETERTRAAAEAEVVESDRVLAVEQRRVTLEKALLDAAIPAELRSRREHEEKQMARERAEVELRKAEADLEAAHVTARAEAAIRELAFHKATAELATAERGIAALTLVAPEDGAVVVGDNPRERRKVQTGDMVWPGIVVARVAQSGALQAEAILHDVDDGRVVPGDSALLVPDAFPARRLPARVADVTAVAQQLSNESPRRAFRVLLKLAAGAPVEGLRPGLSVKVELGKRGDGQQAAPEEDAALPRPTDETVRVTRETFVSAVEMKGTLRALDSQPLGPPQVPDLWEYRITMMAPEGSSARKGQPVLAFDTTTVRQRLEEKKAEAESAGKQIEKRERDLALRREQIALGRAEAEARRKKAGLKVDVPEELGSAIEAKKARLDLALAARESALLAEKAAAAARAAEAELSILANRRDAARLRVQQLETVLPQMTIPAPRNGLVIWMANWRDEKKKVGDVCWRSENVLDVPDISHLGVTAEVDEADSGRVAVGQPASIRLDASPDQEFRATVVSIRQTIGRASPKNPLKVVRMELKLDRVDPKMRPGMRVRGRVEIDRVPRAIVVPADCLLVAAQKPAVFRKSGGRVRTVPVTPGRRADGRVEILSGLSEGDVLVKPEKQETGS